MTPSFYKILQDPSDRHLSLPPEFVSKHLKNKVPYAPIIRTANGGYLWRLNIKYIGDSYCFTNGWNIVAKESHLGFGDLLFFRLVNRTTFEMKIYSPDGCEITLPPKNEHDDPIFMPLLTKDYRSRLRFPPEFAALAGIDGEGTMTVKNIDGKEWVTVLRLDASYKSKRYCLGSGWGRFWRENKLSIGDECVFKFIRSEGKLLLAEVTKEKCTFNMPTNGPHGRENILLPKVEHDGGSVDEDDENDGDEEEKEDDDPDYDYGYVNRDYVVYDYVNHGDDDDDDDEKNIGNNDDDPFFRRLLTKSYKSRLRFPKEFARLAGIDGEGTMTLKNVDGREWVLALKLDHSYRSTKRYMLASGWGRFWRENKLSIGDKCVFKFIRSEGKLLLAEVAKTKSTFNMPTYRPHGCEKILLPKVEHDVGSVDEDDENDGDDEEKEDDDPDYDYVDYGYANRDYAVYDYVNDGDDDDDDEKNIGNNDDDPFFRQLLKKSYKSRLRFPKEFARLAGIDGEGTMTLKNVDGREWVLALKLDHSYRSTKRYMLASGWGRFWRENKLSIGDKCVFKFIRSEGKLLLAKVTKTKTIEALVNRR
ncbi:B3 domain-containing protein REM6-like [Bidens hawaiensis]|uniref:B3 domain-containing protein REM6-like n=1 Tax=Bidens hawaiensis TaxID=980011 RepID=UPI0040490F9C